MKVKLYIQAVKWDFEKEFSIEVTGYKPTYLGEGKTLIPIAETEVDIDVELPSHETLVQAQIEQLEGKKTDIQAECNARIVSIDSKIGELLALKGE